MTLPSANNVWMVVWPAIVAFALGTMAAERVSLVLESRRTGDRFEMIRSGLVASVMALFTAGAAYVSIVRLIGLFA